METKSVRADVSDRTFSYDQPAEAAKSQYTVEFPNLRVLEFNFTAIQLNRLNWRDFIDRPNPVAAALMSKMSIEKKDRPKVKAECLRLLVTLKLNPAKSRLISQFVDTYLYPHYHTADYTPDKINFDRFTRVVAGLVEVVSDLAK